MKKRALVSCIVALAALSSTPMFVNTIFNFSFTEGRTDRGFSAPFSGSGQFDTQATSTLGQYQIVGVTGTTAGQTIAQLIASGGFGGNDNLLFYTNGSASASLDFNGVSYQLANGFNTNLYLDTTSRSPVNREIVFFQQQSSPISITPVAISAVSEPATVALLGTGILGLAIGLRRRSA